MARYKEKTKTYTAEELKEELSKKIDIEGKLKQRDKENKELEIYYSDIIHTLKLKDELGLHVYLSNRKKIEDKYKETGSWDEVITTVVYCDEITSNEAFIDIIESMYKTKVKDAKHLKKLTGIKEETLKGLQSSIYASREAKFLDVLCNALNNGAKYKDLLKYEPKDYSLPESWESLENYKMNKEKLIKQAIHEVFHLGEMDLSIQPDIRTVADKLEAPYSFILETQYYYSSYWEEVNKKNGNNKR